MKVGCYTVGLLLLGVEAFGGMTKPPIYQCGLCFFSHMPQLFQSKSEDKKLFFEKIEEQLKSSQSQLTTYYLASDRWYNAQKKWCNGCPFYLHEIGLASSYVKKRNEVIASGGLGAVNADLAERAFKDFWNNNKLLFRGKPCRKKLCDKVLNKAKLWDKKIAVLKSLVPELSNESKITGERLAQFQQYDFWLHDNGLDSFRKKRKETKKLCLLIQLLNPGDKKNGCKEVIKSFLKAPNCTDCFLKVWDLREKYGSPEKAVEEIDTYFADKVPA